MSNRKIILVPMLIDAYLNIDPNLTSAIDPNDRAYLAPITTPNIPGLRLDSTLIQHDIFDDIRRAPYETCADRYRKTRSRQGVYIHWSLPRPYRVGITASGSALNDLPLKLKQGGYPSWEVTQSLSDRLPLFRTVPARWIIVRTIKPLNGHISCENPNVSFEAQIQQMFVVESDCIRPIDSIPAAEDVEVLSSPYIDSTLPPNQQGQTYLGRCSRFEDWPGDQYPIQNLTPITVNQNGNPYFADYQPQNAGVFSFFDDLGVPNTSYKFTNASISYTVIGYHDDEGGDILKSNVFINQSPAEKLAACQMTLSKDAPLTADETGWLNLPITPELQNNQMRALCHGSFYNIAWNIPSSGSNIPTTLQFPADILQQSFSHSHPLSVGTNAIDALFGWLDSTTSSDTIGSGDLKRYLTKLQTLVLDMNDDIDSQLQAEDLLATNNFLPSPQGIIWHFKDKSTDTDSSKLTPSQEQAAALTTMNMQQRVVNALLRRQANLQRQLYLTWFTYVADRNTGSSSDQQHRVSLMTQEITSLRTQYGNNATAIGKMQSIIKAAQDNIPGNAAVVAGTEPNFYMQRDPTLLIAGLSSKWPTDFNEDVQVRLQSQASTYIDAQGMSQPLPDTPNGPSLAAKLPPMFRDPVQKLLGEAEIERDGVLHTPVKPLYFGDRDRYTGQNGWFPLLIEWEVEYYHIPFLNWTFAPQGPEARIGYGLKNGFDPSSSDIQGDYRVIGGRCPILPQAGAILEATLKQVFTKANPEVLKAALGDIDPETILSAARKLDLSSTPLSGFTDQLVTKMQGTHTTPTYAEDGGPWGTLKVNIRDDAKLIGNEIGMTEEDFALMTDENDLTPFASLVDMPADLSRHNPFKPCIHGQFRFTKLNIIDKFGQVVQGIKTVSDVAHGVGPTITPLFPCLGASYSVEQTSQGYPKIVLPRQDTLCPFVQLPPSINQNARVNADFMVPEGNTWRAVNDWENPVRGWIVANFPNSSVQIFTPDGEFVREFSAVNGVPIVRPFAGDDVLLGELDPFMASIIKQFMYSGYLAGLFRTLLTTMQAVQANPSSYGESLLSTLGRPLALTTFGVSLELADPPLQSQCTLPSRASIDNLLSYKFGIKIGDKDNVFDGLYGYFPASQTGTVDLSSFYSYHAPSGTVDKPIPNDPSKPMPTDLLMAPFYAEATLDPAIYAQTQHQAAHIFAGLIDPFTPTHVYSALLPIKQLKLPQWTIDAGVHRITAFFKLGPLLVPGDVPAYDASKVVAKDYKLDDPNAPQANGKLPVPAVSVMDWAWLQPYEDTGPNGEERSTVYNSMDVMAVGDKPVLDVGTPHTAVEGFLQMKTPFAAPS